MTKILIDKDKFLKSVQAEIHHDSQPTDKQIELVKEICCAFGREYPPDGIKTKKEFGEFISNNFEEYRDWYWDCYASCIDHYDNFGDRI